MIIGLAGKKESGKTTAAQSIVDSLGFKKLSFAEPVKKMIDSLLFDLGCTETGKKDLAQYIQVTKRYLYQTLGTEWGRKMIHPNIWLMIADIRVIEVIDIGYEHIVIDDVRFENEADYIRERGGVIIHIERLGLVSTDEHFSEKGIAFKKGDIHLANNRLDVFLSDFNCIVLNLIN